MGQFVFSGSLQVFFEADCSLGAAIVVVRVRSNLGEVRAVLQDNSGTFSVELCYSLQILLLGGGRFYLSLSAIVVSSC